MEKPALKYDKKEYFDRELWHNVGTDRLTSDAGFHVSWSCKEPFEDMNIDVYIVTFVRPALIALQKKLKDMKQSNKAVHVDQKDCG